MRHALLVAVCVAGISIQQTGYAQAGSGYTCRWYLMNETSGQYGGRVKFVVEDPQRSIWTATGGRYSSTIWTFDGTKWSRRFRIGEPGSSISSVACDRREGGMYFAAKQGLLRATSDIWELHTKLFIVHVFGSSLFMGDQTFNAVPTQVVYVDKRNDIWVYAPNIGLFRRTGGVWNEHTTYWPQDGGRTKLVDVLGGKPVTALHALSEETIAVGTEAGSLYILREQASRRSAEGTDVEVAKKHDVGTIGIPEGSRINAITSDSSGHVWIAYSKGRKEGGVACLKDDEWQLYSHVNSQLPARPVTAIAAVSPGRIWAGITWNDPTRHAPPKGISYDKTGLLEFSQGKWRSIETEGFSATVKRVLHLGPGGPREVYLDNTSYRHIDCIEPDSRGNIWVGTHLGVACFVPRVANGKRDAPTGR